MIVEKTFIKDLLIIKPKIFSDNRGYFFESFSKKKYEKDIGINFNFVQDNESKSSYGVLRGLHFQKGKYAQGKLVRVVVGKVQDVAVDIRKNSPTFGKYYSVILSEENKLQFWIPPGFAHGFAVLSDIAIFQYKCTNYYSPENECGIIYNDEDLKIEWLIDNPIVSEKDKNYPQFKDLDCYF